MKQVLQHILTLLVALTAYINMCAQTVTNVEARQEGQTIVITFNMDKPADVSLYYSTSGKYGKYMWINSKYLTKQRISSTKYSYTWDVLGQCGEFSFNNVVFRVEAKEIKTMPFLISFGGFYSLINNELGTIYKIGYKAVYLGLKTNFLIIESNANFESTAQGSYYEKNSEEVSRWSALLGLNLLRRERFSFYTGLGYGFRNYYAKVVSQYAAQNGKICKITDNSAKGLELECGVNWFMSDYFGYSIGYSVLAFKYSELTGGIILRW